jgi:hypothetical protein
MEFSVYIAPIRYNVFLRSPALRGLRTLINYR